MIIHRYTEKGSVASASQEGNPVHTTVWMESENVALREANQVQKANMGCTITLTYVSKVELIQKQAWWLWGLREIWVIFPNILYNNSELGVWFSWWLASAPSPMLYLQHFINLVW